MGTRVTQQYVQVAYQNNGANPLEPSVTTAMALSGTARILVDSFFVATTTTAFAVTASADKAGIIVSASNQLNLLNSIQSGFFDKTVTSVLDLISTAKLPELIDALGTSTLEFTVIADSGVIGTEALNDVALTQLASVAVNGVPAEASNALNLLNTPTFNMSFNAIAPFIPEGGLEPIDDSESLFRMAGTATFETEFTNTPEASEVTFLQTASVVIVPGKTGFNKIILSQEATRLMDYSRGLSNDLGLVQAGTVQHLRDGVPVGGLCTYNPILSELSTMPTTYASSEGQLKLEYPLVTPTSTLNLRNSEFGESYDIGFDRLNAITRGNELVVFGDSHWPEIETFNLSVRNLTTAQRDSIISFIVLTLGRTIKLTDHFGQIWNVIITTPDADFLDERGDGCTFTWAFTCEGTRL